MVYQRQGGKIYFQSLMVIDVDKVPEGYTLRQFPASDFLVITYEWLPTNEEAIHHGIGAGWEHIKTILRYDEPGSPITVIEKENVDADQKNPRISLAERYIGGRGRKQKCSALFGRYSRIRKGMGQRDDRLLKGRKRLSAVPFMPLKRLSGGGAGAKSRPSCLLMR